jgi:hypothetical protein
MGAFGHQEIFASERLVNLQGGQAPPNLSAGLA